MDQTQTAKTPVAIKAIAVFILLCGLLGLLIWTYYNLLFGIKYLFSFQSALFLFEIFTATIIPAIGLWKMKRWALYLLTFCVFIGFISIAVAYSVGGNPMLLQGLFSDAVSILMLSYLWIHRKDFR